jgi:transposase
MAVAMMGERSGSQGRFFYRFDLEKRIPTDHLLRKIDAVLDLSKLRSQLAPHYSHTGRPSIDPELMIRMLLIGYCYGIRSERRLCEEVDLNLAYRWFCRLNLENRVPDQSTFCKNRHGRFREADILRHVFETTVQTCMDKDLVGGEGFAADASIIRANANRRRGRKQPTVDSPIAKATSSYQQNSPLAALTLQHQLHSKSSPDVGLQNFGQPFARQYSTRPRSRTYALNRSVLRKGA